MKRSIVFLLFPKTHLMDLAGPAQVFYEAGQLGRQPFELIFASGSVSIPSAQGLVFGQLHAIERLTLKKGDLVCIPGIDFKSFVAGELDPYIGEVQRWVKIQQKAGVLISSICSGALVLARMGLLNGVRCTTHWKCMSYLKEQFPYARLQTNRLYCFDKGIFTSAGMSSGIDMAMALVEQWINPLLAAKVAQEMVINIRRAETDQQQNLFLDFKNHFNPDVYKAQQILSNRLEASFTIKDLAKALNLSPRHLARLFKHHTGQTIQSYRDKIRLEHGEKLLLHSEMSIKEIAVQCGFENARQFIRLWKTKKGCPPGQFRNQRNAAITTNG